jgi:hypothetical protein
MIQFRAAFATVHSVIGVLSPTLEAKHSVCRQDKEKGEQDDNGKHQVLSFHGFASFLSIMVAGSSVEKCGLKYVIYSFQKKQGHHCPCPW